MAALKGSTDDDALVPLLFHVSRLLAERMRAESPDVVRDMTTTHLFALRYLAEHPQVTSKDLAAHLDVTKQAISQLVRLLESGGLVKRTANPEDRRSWVLRLTSSGEALLAEGHRRWLEIEGEWEDLIGPRRLAQLRRVVHIILDATIDQSDDHLTR